MEFITSQVTPDVFANVQNQAAARLDQAVDGTRDFLAEQLGTGVLILGEVRTDFSVEAPSAPVGEPL